MKDEQMRLGIIGTGVMARRIADTAEQMQNVSISAVFSPDSLELQSFSYTFSVPHAYRTCEELLQDKDVDAVYVACPTSHHYMYSKMALEAGKHVICETPFTVTVEQAEALFALSAEKNLFICESSALRCNPLVTTLHDVIMSDEAGYPLSMMAEASFNYDNLPRIRDPKLAGGCLYEVSVYPLIWTYLVFGSKLTNKHSVVLRDRNGIDEQCSLTCIFPDERMAVIHCSIKTQGANKVQICCQERRIDIDNIADFKKIVIYNASGSVYKTYEAPPMISGYEYVLEGARKAILEGKIDCPHLRHGETLRIMGIIDSLRKNWSLDYPKSVTSL